MPTVKPARRIAAWIYVVVNPIIDSLEREPSLLESGNLTWRAYLGRCEIIKTIQEYVDSAQWPNYETFRSEHADSIIVRGFDQHDSTLKDLNATAQQLFHNLTSAKEFLQTAESQMQAYERQREAAGGQAQWPPAYIRQELVRFSAEYVINNIQSLPSHYATAEFWNSFGKVLLAFRNRPDFGSLYQNATGLAETSARVRQALLEYRLIKSREYDVPAAHVPGLSLDAE